MSNMLRTMARGSRAVNEWKGPKRRARAAPPAENGYAPRTQTVNGSRPTILAKLRAFFGRA